MQGAIERRSLPIRVIDECRRRSARFRAADRLAECASVSPCVCVSIRGEVAACFKV